MPEVDVNRKDLDGLTALHHAVVGGHLEVVRILCCAMRKYGLSFEVVDPLGLTPFLCACRYGRHDIASLLAASGANVSGADGQRFLGADDWTKIGKQEQRNRFRKELRHKISHFMIKGVYLTAGNRQLNHLGIFYTCVRVMRLM